MSESATEVLRRLLDERGVEWKDGDAAYEIEWSTPDGRHCSAMYWKPTFFVLIRDCTPEQAIAATLGSGTCCIVKTPSDSDFSDDWRYRCSECGCNIPVNERDPETGDVINAANYCPNCGRKTVKQ